MNQKQYAAIAEDLRKIGTTAVAGALVSIFITDQPDPDCLYPRNRGGSVVGRYLDDTGGMI